MAKDILVDRWRTTLVAILDTIFNGIMTTFKPQPHKIIGEPLGNWLKWPLSSFGTVISYRLSPREKSVFGKPASIFHV